MIRNWKSSALVTAFVFFAMPALVNAQGSDGKKDDDLKTVLKKLEELDKRLDNMNEGIKDSFTKARADIASVQSNHQMLKTDLVAAIRRIDDLEKLAKTLRADLENVKKNGSTESPAPVDKQIVEELRDRLKDLDRALAKLGTPGDTSISRSAPPMTGKVQFTNNYSEELTLIVNDKRVSVAPGMTAVFDMVPVGTFSYKIISARYGEIRSVPSAVLNPGKTFSFSAELR